MLPLPHIGCGQGDHLILLQSPLQLPLVVTAAGVATVLLYPNDTVENELAISSAVKRQIQLLKGTVHGRKGDLIPSTENEGEHTATGDSQRERAPG